MIFYVILAYVIKKLSNGGNDGTPFFIDAFLKIIVHHHS